MTRTFNRLFLFLLLLLTPLNAQGEERTFKVTFYCSCPICVGHYSTSFGGKGNTATGRVPLPFRTVAVGDPSLLGKWIYFEDLGGWVLASDTGAKCQNTSKTTLRRISDHARTGWKTLLSLSSLKGCVAQNQVDVFVGGPTMHKRALEMGVQEWKGRILEEMVPDNPMRRAER